MAKTAQEVRELIAETQGVLLHLESRLTTTRQKRVAAQLHESLRVASAEVAERWSDLFPDDNEEGAKVALSIGGDK